MISRRNIRIKVMQLLYGLDMFEPENTVPSFSQLEKLLRKRIEQARTLDVYLLLNIIEIARYAEVYAQQRASKNIKTHEDLNVNIKISGNEVIWKIRENPQFQSLVAQERISLMIDSEIIKKLFLQLIESEIYQQYISEQHRYKKSETEILQYILTDLLLVDETFIYKTEELFQNWDDDCVAAEQTVLEYLQKPLSPDLQEAISPDKWQFAKDLLATVIEKDTMLMDLIKPKLQNWEVERIAVIDMILLKMGLSELLFFETIPTKVTINEYIDIAKDYSTNLSGRFVNGILDSIHKELISQNKIHKIDFRKR